MHSAFIELYYRGGQYRWMLIFKELVVFKVLGYLCVFIMSYSDIMSMKNSLFVQFPLFSLLEQYLLHFLKKIINFLPVPVFIWSLHIKYQVKPIQIWYE